MLMFINAFKRTSNHKSSTLTTVLVSSRKRAGHKMEDVNRLHINFGQMRLGVLGVPSVNLSTVATIA